MNAPADRPHRDDASPLSWRDLVASASASAHAPLALGVELRQREPHDPRRWDPRTTEAVTPRALARRQDELQLAVRPLTRGARGGWVKKDAAWDDVRRSTSRFAPDAVRWFTELFAIARPSAAVGAFSSVSEWVSLGSSSSSLLWMHLRAAERAGVALVTTHPQQSIALAGTAAVDVLVGPESGGTLRVAARISVDGAPTEVSRVRPLGTSAFFSFTLDTEVIGITIAPATLDDTVTALLGAPEGVEVPAHEAVEFVREAYPRLARRTRVTPVGGLDPPPAPRPSLRLTAAFDEDAVAYALEWIYPGLAPFPYPAVEHPERDTAAEAERAAALTLAWAGASDLPFAASSTLRGPDAGEFSTQIVPALQQLDDVRVEITGARPSVRELTGAPEVSVTTVPTDDPDWFDLGVIVTIEGRWVPLAPLLTALARGRRRMRLSDGAYFSLAHPALTRLKELLDEAASLDEWETGERIHRHQTALWSDFEDLADQAEPAQTWRRLVRGLASTDRVEETELPEGLQADLRGYQKRGFDWLAFLWRHRLGGILADDMGLGKTLQVLALMLHARERGEQRPFLVVAPTSVLATWREEAARFAPGLVVRTIEATVAKTGMTVTDASAGADVVVTSYAILRLDEAPFTAERWAGVVLDEAQFVKNPQTSVHRAAKNLKADMTIALTGTPLENGLGDLWALFSLTAPGLFPSARRFRDEYVLPIENARRDDASASAHGAERLARLRRRIRPLMLRRTKELVAPELPLKQEQDLHIDLSTEHRALYDTVLHRERQKVLGLLDDLDRHRFIVFRSLTLLRMLSLHPALIDERHAPIGSSKLDALLTRLTEVIAEGHRALVFSQFTSFLSLAADRLDAAGIAYAHLDGSTLRRGEVVEGFRSGEAPVFLISLKAGGFGLTLTEADYVFLLDPWWNPAAEAQAIDRAHRIGQDRHVFVYRMLASDTIEEKVRLLQQRKSELFDAVVDDGDLFAESLSADDIRGLLDL